MLCYASALALQQHWQLAQLRAGTAPDAPASSYPWGCLAHGPQEGNPCRAALPSGDNDCRDTGHTLCRDTGRSQCRDPGHTPCKVTGHTPSLALPLPASLRQGASRQVSWQRPHLLLSTIRRCFAQEASDASLPQSAALHAQLRATRC